MKYAHLADLHLGSWRDQKMRDVSTKAFLTAIDMCIEQNVDFLLFAGDLFNTSLPSLDTLKIVTKKLKELLDRNIPIYVIAGSHDFSPSGKTMIDVLEHAGLLKNVCKGKVDPETKQLNLQFTIDQKTGAKITGILGRKGLLDKSYYENLNLQLLEKEEGYKIFQFHTTLSELKPKHLEKLESHPVSFLPKGFNYYAGGHIHHPSKIDIPEWGPLTYPGALFPNNFAELEKYGKGGFYLIETTEIINRSKEINSFSNKEIASDSNKEITSSFNKDITPGSNKEIGSGSNKEITSSFNSPSSQQNISQNITWMPLDVIKHHPLRLDCQHKSPEVISFEILNHFNQHDLHDTIITLRLSGELAAGRISDINFKPIFDQLYSQGAYFIMKNTSELSSQEFSEIKITPRNSESLEEEIIHEHLQQMKLFSPEKEMELTKNLLSALNTIKKEGETVTDFQRRVEEEANRILLLDQ